MSYMYTGVGDWTLDTQSLGLVDMKLKKTDNGHIFFAPALIIEQSSTGRRK